MSDELKLPQVGELTFPQWQDWLTRYNAVLAERDSRIEKLEEALNCNLPDYDPKIGIVERLRQLGNWRVDGTKSSPIYNKSADRIEKLEAALIDILKVPRSEASWGIALVIAHHALKEGKDD